VTADTLSLLAVNGASALVLGMSFALAVDVVPWLRRSARWRAVVVVLLVAWSGLILWANSLPHPEGLQVRRVMGGAVSLWVAYLFVRYVRSTPDRSEDDHEGTGENR